MPTIKLIKFCCVLTYPLYINCGIVIAHKGDEPAKDSPEKKSHILSCASVVANERYVKLCYV